MQEYKPPLSRICVKAFTQKASAYYGVRSINPALFYMPRKSLRIRRGRGLLANDNPASTFPGQQSVKRRAKVSVNVGVLQECLYSASARSLRRRSALVAENTRPTCAKWSAYTAQICVRSINPALSPVHTYDADEPPAAAGTHFHADDPPHRFILRRLPPMI